MPNRGRSAVLANCDHLELEGGAALAHHVKLVPLAFAVELRREIWTAAGQQEAVNRGQQTATSSQVRRAAEAR